MEYNGFVLIKVRFWFWVLQTKPIFFMINVFRQPKLMSVIQVWFLQPAILHWKPGPIFIQRNFENFNIFLTMFCEYRPSFITLLAERSQNLLWHTVNKVSYIIKFYVTSRRKCYKASLCQVPSTCFIKLYMTSGSSLDEIHKCKMSHFNM